MTGIIKKDLYLLQGLNSSFFLFLGFFVLIPIFTGATSMVTVMLPVVVSTISINLLAYDRQCEWDQYAAALPVLLRGDSRRGFEARKPVLGQCCRGG